MSKRAAILHGAGYVGRELMGLLARHPEFELSQVTSRSRAGRPYAEAHPAMAGTVHGAFVDPDDLDATSHDVLFIAAEHGQSVGIVGPLLEGGYTGVIIDLSADFRLRRPSDYTNWYGFDHPDTALLGDFVYGMPDVYAPYAEGSRLVANPGCFATGISLALYPIARRVPDFHASVTALTGASGSGTRAKATTHFPRRDGNVRAYKALNHRHLAEVMQVVGDDATVQFVPVSGPWTRGIWGTAHIRLAGGAAGEVDAWFRDAYDGCELIRLRQGMPELLDTVNTPFCDLGWEVRDEHVVVGFALDNLLKGAASQAVHNANLVFGLPATTGLLP